MSVTYPAEEKLFNSENLDKQWETSIFQKKLGPHILGQNMYMLCVLVYYENCHFSFSNNTEHTNPES